MRRLDLRSTFRGWANSHEVPGINRDVLLWEVQVFTAKRLYPGAQGQPRFAASPWVHDVPRTHRASPRQRHTPAFAEPATNRYARHGRELMGCKSPVRRRESKGEQHANWSLLI
jgi:hypothetical protein